MNSCLVIYNPNSGKVKKENLKGNFIESFKSILNEYGYKVTFIDTQYKGHATKIVEKSPFYDLVISIGGDGTFNEVMRGNLNREERLLLAHIPLGTTNDIGAMWGYGKDIMMNLRQLLEGEVKEIDICTVNDKPFVYVAGFGKFMNIPYDTPRDLKKKYGYLAYLINAINIFKQKTQLYDLSFTVNGETYRGLYSFALITNATRVAGINNFYDNIKLNDNQFEVLFSNLTTKKDIIKTLALLVTNNITNVPGFYFYKTDKITITFHNDLKYPWCIDGEELDENPRQYSIEIKKDVKVKLPKKNIDKLFK